MTASGRNHQNFPLKLRVESEESKAYLLALRENSAWIIQRKNKMKCPLGTPDCGPVELSSISLLDSLPNTLIHLWEI